MKSKIPINSTFSHSSACKEIIKDRLVYRESPFWLIQELTDGDIPVRLRIKMGNTAITEVRTDGEGI